MVDLALEILYQDDIFEIHLDKRFSVLQLAFRKQPDADHFRNAYRLAIETALRKNVRYWLTDARQIRTMEPENQGWLVQNMAPLLQSFQIRKFAIVMSPECFVMTNPNQVYNKVSPGNEAPATGSIKVHFDMEAAFDWIFSLESVG